MDGLIISLLVLLLGGYSWMGYRLGKIEERLKNIEKRLFQINEELKEIREMLRR